MSVSAMKRFLIIFLLTTFTVFIYLNSSFDPKYKNFGFSRKEVSNIVDVNIDLSETYLLVNQLLNTHGIIEDYSLIQDLIMDKCINKTLKFEISSEDIRIDSTYWVIFEECYVVDLIQRHSKHPTSIADYSYNTAYLSQNYDDLLIFDKINPSNSFEKKLYFINNYIASYSFGENPK